MVELLTEVDTKNLERAIKIAPRVLKFELADGMDRIGKGFLKRFRQKQLQGPPEGIRGASGHGLFGTFKRVSLVSPTIDGMGIEIFSNSKIARLHETGGIIRSKSGGRLAVPLSARSEMFKKDKLLARYKKPYELKNIKAMRFKGKTFLARVTKRAQKILPLYVLKRQVRIKPRLGFYRTWDGLVNYRIDILNKSIEKALRKI
jgi:hypothetical protein